MMSRCSKEGFHARAKAYARMARVVWATVVLLCAVTVHSAVIRDIIPYRGSVVGGTKLTVVGAGFARDGQEGSTTVSRARSRARSVV